MARVVHGPGQEVYKLPAMTGDEVDRLLKSRRICRMALNDRPQPYIIPLDYVYANGKLYFHFADYGKKVELFRSDPHVSVEVDRFNDDISSYENVTLMGVLTEVASPEEKRMASQELLRTIESRGGEKNVAARHGYERLDPDILSSKGSMVLRMDVSDYIGLKSPGP